MKTAITASGEPLCAGIVSIGSLVGAVNCYLLSSRGTGSPFCNYRGEARRVVGLDGEVAGLEVSHHVCCVPGPLIPLPDCEDNIRKHRWNFRCKSFSESARHELNSPKDEIGFPFNVGQEDEVTAASVAQLSQKAFELLLGNSPVGLRTDGLATDDQAEGCIIESGEGVDDEAAVGAPSVDCAEFLSIALILEIVKGFE